ncbi:MAG TPA: hypothetical protein VKA06_06830, partial [Spirochaetia bacterium]|nr:hypothetical protein [Spirochaetia bacterium]
MPLPEPEESLRIADSDIENQEYNDAVPRLVDAVRADEEQLPAAESRFERIRAARTAYVEKGREVEAELRELIAGDIAPDQVVPTAFEALRLIGEMNEILPNPNTEDERLIANLQSRVLLTIDRRRFESLMAAAAEEIEAENYVAAVEIYINGLGEYGFETGTDAVAEGGIVAEGQAQIEALLETDGIAIQIGSFNPADYQLTGARFAAARTTVRDLATAGGDESGEVTFAATAEPAEAQAQAMIESFAAGDFDDAQEQIDAYLPLLADISTVYRGVRGAAELIAAQESLNAEQALVDENYRYNYHIRFVNDIVHGRPTEGDSDVRRPEGVLHAVESVWRIVANGPVEATRSFGESRYADAIEALTDFPWTEIVSPTDDARAAAHQSEMNNLLDRISISYRTTLEILDVSRALEIGVPDSSDITAASDLAPLVESVEALTDEDLRSILFEALARSGSAEEFDDAIEEVVGAYAVGTPALPATSTPLLDSRRAAIRGRLDSMYALTDRWEEYVSRFVDDDAEEAILTAAPEHSRYLASQIELARSYELDVVRRLADIQLADLDERLASSETAVSAARRDLSAIDPVSGAPRPRTAQARDRLRPLVGTATSRLPVLRREALALVDDLRSEEEYIRRDEEIQRVIARAEQIAATIGTTASGLVESASTLLSRSNEQIANAERLEGLAFDQVAAIDRTIDEAESQNTEGNVLEAGLLLDDAEDLLSSNSPNDASNLFTASLENWYRTDIERQWETLRERLSARLNDARRDIVLARVDILAEQAEPLVNPPPGQDPRPGEALLVLEEAEALWATVYPLVQNPVITPLLRRARILESQQQQDLTEDIPGFERLSQILNTARTAYDQRDYSTAQRALDFFLIEQPLNAEARLLDIRLELETAQGSADAIVSNYVLRSLDEVTTGENVANDGTSVESQIVTAARQLRATDGRSGVVSDAVFNGLLPLRSKLSAIRQIVEQQGGVSQANVNRISGLIADIN